MKLSNEIKVAILAIVAIGLFIFGFNFLKGKNIFTASNYFYVEYEEVSGLTKSAMVLINGFQVGIVTSLYLKEDGSGKIMAELQLNRGVEIPANSVASIASTDPLSGKVIKLIYDKPCGGANPCAESGDTLKASVTGMLAGMLGAEGVDQLNKATDMAKDIFGKIKGQLEGEGDGKMKMDLEEGLNDLKETLNSLNSASRKLNRMLGSSEPQIKELFGNLNSLTGTLNSKTGQIGKIFDNAEELTANLKDVDLNGTLEKANGAIGSLEETLGNADKAIESLTGLLEKVNAGEGTISKLLNEDEVYVEALNALRDLDFLLKDFRLNPKRYVNVSVIGRKGKPYDNVADDPEGRVDGSEPKEKKEEK